MDEACPEFEIWTNYLSKHDKTFYARKNYTYYMLSPLYFYSFIPLYNELYNELYKAFYDCFSTTGCLTLKCAIVNGSEG